MEPKPGTAYGRQAVREIAGMGLSVARSTLCRALARLAKKARPIYAGLVAAIRGSPVFTP